MTDSRTWFSHVVFRPVADGDNAISLGFLVELATPGVWAIAAVMRGTLAEEQTSGLDDISRTLIEHRVDVVRKEMDHILDTAKKPGDALALLAAVNPWSFQITAPQAVKIDKAAPKPSADSIDKLLQGYVSWMHAKMWLPDVQAKERRPRVTVATPRPAMKIHTLPARMPEPWMLPPVVMWRPLAA
jgi:hypothetical protein